MGGHRCPGPSDLGYVELARLLVEHGVDTTAQRLWQRDTGHIPLFSSWFLKYDFYLHPSLFPINVFHSSVIIFLSEFPGSGWPYSHHQSHILSLA